MPLQTVLVEDSPAIRVLLIESMMDSGDIELIDYAESEEHGLHLFETYKDRWQLAVLDLVLNKGNGLNIARALTNRKLGQSVVVLTNYADPHTRTECQLAGVDAIFDKLTELTKFFEYCHALSAK